QVEGSTTTVLGGINRPPFEPEQSAALFARATSLAAELGLPAPEGVSVGGASDGNFTAGDGIPTLDGLGASVTVPTPNTSMPSSPRSPRGRRCWPRSSPTSCRADTVSRLHGVSG